MFAQVHYPNSLIAAELDDYLAQGWFRMGQTIFTTNFLNFDKQFYSAIWLRIVLEHVETDKNFKKLSNLNKAFKVGIQKAEITPEKEDLYTLYKTGINFSASKSIQDLLLEEQAQSIFDTYEVNLYDGDKLIGCGYFDMGENTAAGITSFFDPAYKKYSLGRYIIYLKIEYCKQKGLKYFYPGYFAPHYPKFDYKLEMGKSSLEYFNLTEHKWFHIEEFNLDAHPYLLMSEKLKVIADLFTQNDIHFKSYHYEYYNANLIPNLKGLHLFDYPVFLKLMDINTFLQALIVFDVRDMRYHFMLCDSLIEIDYSNGIEGYFGDHLLKIDQYIFSTEFPERLLEIIEMVSMGGQAQQ